MIPLAFSTNAFKKNTFEEALRAIAGIGYSAVELMADLHHAYPPLMTWQRTAEIKGLLKELGLTVSNVNAFTLFACGDTYRPTWIDNSSAERKRRVEHTLGAIRVAAEFGAKTVSLQPGGPMIGSGLSRAEAGRMFAEGLAQCVDLAREKGVILAIEPEPGLFIQTAAEYLDFKREFFRDESAVQMNCDTGHLFCCGEDPAAVIRNHAEHISHIHIEDIGANRVHQHLTPGKGAMDFPAIFEAVERVGYKRPVTVELYPYETTAAGVAEMAYRHLKPMVG
ncbi:MAG TPA: sugar phosphate isomerase/epimerase [Tepidisphaeraceae bacterium]|nr:sugar phosphate isomerase/epimerase [Tepidisphaeraceae bacterium]